MSTLSSTVPDRLLIRNRVLIAWKTCSGPTATQGSGGSPEVATAVVLARPANAVAWVISTSALVVAKVGAGTAFVDGEAARRPPNGFSSLGVYGDAIPFAGGRLPTSTLRNGRPPKLARPGSSSNRIERCDDSGDRAWATVVPTALAARAASVASRTRRDAA